jgi:hypothetical protein
VFIHGLINNKDTTPKCRLYWCLIEFIYWRNSQSCWYFRPSFVYYCTLTFFLVHKTKVHYLHTVQCVAWNWKGWGMLSYVGDHILQEINTLFLTRFRITKLLHHPKQKPRRGGGLRQINTCSKVLFTGQLY